MDMPTQAVKAFLCVRRNLLAPWQTPPIVGIEEVIVLYVSSTEALSVTSLLVDMSANQYDTTGA